ncbi:MAG TPA: amidohydrolase family protein [Candidatus Dormibacteraeota bacterium]|nr:amidohydrolase family protein [Candidatus Dormibacteraeota bacterium]
MSAESDERVRCNAGEPHELDRPSPEPPNSRRQFLRSMGALGAAAMLPGAAGLAAPLDAISVGTAPGRIDVHEHMFSPAYRHIAKMPKLSARPGGNRRASPLLAHWTPEGALEQMKKNGTATAVLSIPVTGYSFAALSREEARTLARGNNEYGAQVAKDYPGRFGFFASLPLLNTEDSLKEIEYSYDTLNATGIGLFTSYGTKWPGDPAFEPVFAELNRRKAVVFIHPTTPACCGELIPGVSPVWVEFDFDTVRSALSLLVNHTFEKFPDIKFILTHSGGALPVETARIQGIVDPGVAGSQPGTVEWYFSHIFYDIANGSNPMALAALTKLVPTSQILFGTDFPYVRMGTTLDGYLKWGFSAKQMRDINRENALRLLTRLKVHA